MEFVYLFAGVILSTIIFSIMFNKLHPDNLKLILPLQKFVRKSKHKAVLRVATFVIAIFLCVIIRDFFNLSYFVFGTIVGFFSALIETIFAK
jgi:hypothetical protein